MCGSGSSENVLSEFMKTHPVPAVFVRIKKICTTTGDGQTGTLQTLEQVTSEHAIE
jgi:hypothetical protein